MPAATDIRHRSFVDLAAAAQPQQGGWTRTRARGKRFAVDWVTAGSGSAPGFDAEIEAIVILPAAPARIAHETGSVAAPARSVVLCPAGRFTVEAAPGTGFALIRPIAGNSPEGAVNEADYGTTDEGIQPLAPADKPRHPGPVVIRAEDIKAPADKPRLKILRSAALSISWIDYDGVRDRTALSPHDHVDFEQGSLALAGHFIHHLRTPWGKNANAWREDEPLEAPSPSLCVIPPRVIHTTEGPRDEPHLLIDIFAPPRADFLAKGWVSNAADYEDLATSAKKTNQGN